jgi:hypothetical protein
MNPFSTGLPGRMKHNCTPFWIAQASPPSGELAAIVKGDTAWHHTTLSHRMAESRHYLRPAH